MTLYGTVVEAIAPTTKTVGAAAEPQNRARHLRLFFRFPRARRGSRPGVWGLVGNGPHESGTAWAGGSGHILLRGEAAATFIYFILYKYIYCEKVGTFIIYGCKGCWDELRRTSRCSVLRGAPLVQRCTTQPHRCSVSALIALDCEETRLPSPCTIRHGFQIRDALLARRDAHPRIG